ncbi:MAG: acyltransferase family protein [Treponema sp.]
MEEKKRLYYVDGLKGICCICICVLHFLLMFIPDGYVGWGCTAEAETNPGAVYFGAFPYSIFTNSSFALYVFMALIAFIPAYSFFSSGKSDFIVKQACVRYFRFLPMVFVSCLISALLNRLSLYPFEQFYEATGNFWIHTQGTLDCSFGAAVRDGLLGGFLHGTDVVTSLWCLHYLFLGSLLSYSILMLYGKIKNRIPLYVVLCIFLYAEPTCLSFIAGIAAADILCSSTLNEKLKKNKILSVVFLIIALVTGNFPPVLLPAWCGVIVFYAIGSFFLLLSVSALFENSRFFKSRILAFLGKESFAIIIIHALVLFSVNANLFLYLNSLGINQGVNILVNFFVFSAASVVLSKLFSMALTPLTNRLCVFVWNKVEDCRT